MRASRSSTGSPSLCTAGAPSARHGGPAAFPPPALPGFIGTIRRSDFHGPICLPRLFGLYRHTPSRKKTVDLPGYRHDRSSSANRPPTPGAPAPLAIRAVQGVAFDDEEHLGAILQVQDFGARYLHGLGAAQVHWSSLAFVPTHQPVRCRPGCKTRYGAGGWPLPRRALPPLVMPALPGRFLHPLVGPLAAGMIYGHTGGRDAEDEACGHA